MSFNPAISHYRREHAPNKKYNTTIISISTIALIRPDLALSDHDW